MHARLLNGISFVAGAGFSLGLFVSIAQFLNIHEQAASRPPDDLETLTAAVFLPPPPPPKPDDVPPVVEDVRDVISLGIQEEPSDSPVKILPSPPAYEELLPVAQLPQQAVAGMIGMDTSIKPKLDVIFDSDHVFQKSEVDKPPIPISRPDPSVPAHLRNNKGFSTLVVFVVDAHGMVGKARILQSSNNPEFDEIVIANVGEWRFAPAIRKGKPVRCMVQQLVRVQWAFRDPFSL